MSRNGITTDKLAAAGAVGKSSGQSKRNDQWLYNACIVPAATKQGRLTLKNGSSGTLMWVIQAGTTTNADETVSKEHQFEPPVHFPKGIYCKVHNVSVAYIAYGE